MTMGPPQAEDALRMTLAMGADRAIHLNDKVFAVADTLGTSRTLALAVAEGGRRPRPLRPQDRGLGNLAGAARDRRLPRLAPAHERRPAGARRRTATRRGGRPTRATTPTSSSLPAVVSVAEGINEGIWPAKRDVEATPTDGPHRSLDRRRPRRRGRGVRHALRPDGLARRGFSPSRTRLPNAAARSPSRPEAAAERILELLRDVEGPPASSWEKPERLGTKPGESYDCWTVVEAGRRRRRAASRWSCSARAASWRASSAG